MVHPPLVLLVENKNLQFNVLMLSPPPAFFYCEVDGSSLCLQCDMTVHVGGKRTHGRYLLLRQRVEVFNFIVPIGFY